jgi:arylsulfatase A-like enzyme
MAIFRARRAWLAVAASIAAVAAVIAVALTSGSTSNGHGDPPLAHGQRANVVFVLADDLSMNLLQYMPHVLAMERGGLTFSNYFVSDSLCCPSRASIFTGNLPHDTHVFNNVPPQGGLATFRAYGEERHTFAVALKRAGYRTAMMGKYLNGYLDQHGPASAPTGAYVPPGWSEWDVAGWGYPEFNYYIYSDGKVVHYGHRRSDYLTDVLARSGVEFINKAASSGKPFFLELATFAPHAPYVPAPRDARAFPGRGAPRTSNFNVLPTNAPDWLAPHKPLTPRRLAVVDTAFRRRVQSVLAIDAMIGRIERTLAADGVARDTYVVFSSDNGYHTGEYRLMPGKLTAFDTDIHVPLVVTGPGVPAGTSTAAMAENIDLAKTFAAIGGTTMPGDGHNLLGLWNGKTPPNWRNAVLIEHHGRNERRDLPDFQEPLSGNPPTYNALRTDTFLYVEYQGDRKREFYDLKRDPLELHNLVQTLTPAQLERLHRALFKARHCHGAASCWTAMHVAPPR